MKFEKFGYWVINDVVKPLAEKAAEEDDAVSEESEPDIEIFTDDPKEIERLRNYNQPKKMNGSCVLSIRFENHGEYLKWKRYFGGGRNWEFITTYPAIMRAEYTFTNSLEVEVMAKKVVQLLEAGFNVYSAQWKLEGRETNNETELNEED